MSAAVNGIGWCVELYTDATGWQQESETFPTKEAALIKLRYSPSDGFERRVYEALL